MLKANVGELGGRVVRELLITGGLGYIGSNLVEYLETKGCNCTIVDKKEDNYVLDIHDVWRYDGVVHLAAMAGISECRDDPENAVINNVISTLYIMQQACNFEKPLVFASSGAAPTPYESLYGMTKMMGEVEAKRLNFIGGKNHVLRFSNVYGGKNWEDKPSVIPLFLNAKSRGEKLIVNGNGKQIRDYIHVLDICKAIYVTLTSDRIVNNPVPICSGRLTNVLELAIMIGGEDGYVLNPESNSVGVMEVESSPVLARDIYNFEAEEDIKEHLNN